VFITGTISANEKIATNKAVSSLDWEIGKV
jgi:hypothetical protein